MGERTVEVLRRPYQNATRISMSPIVSWEGGGLLGPGSKSGNEENEGGKDEKEGADMMERSNNWAQLSISYEGD